jgi:Cu2+-containing amine oxidase
MRKRKLFVSKFEFPTPKGCERVPYTNLLAHIYLMAYHNTRAYPPDEYIIQYSPQEGVTQRHYNMELIENEDTTALWSW